MISLAIVDDHCLLRNALAEQLNASGNCIVTQLASNGKQFMEDFNTACPPAIVLLDIIMPEMDGFDTALWISEHHPAIRVIALSMLCDQNSITRMMKNGAKGFIGKDAGKEELQQALKAVFNNGIYINRYIYNNLLSTISIRTGTAIPDHQKIETLSGREKEFLQLLCTGKGYKEIASLMFVSPRTIDGYRDALFHKLRVSSKIDLVTFAIRNHFAEP